MLKNSLVKEEVIIYKNYSLVSVNYNKNIKNIKKKVI